VSENVQDVVTVKGQAVTVAFDGRFVTISRGRLTSQGRGTRVIPVDQIAGVDMRPATLWTVGSFSLVLPGAVEHRKRSGRRNELRNENTVTFQRKSNEEFAALRDAVLAAIG